MCCIAGLDPNLFVHVFAYFCWKYVYIKQCFYFLAIIQIKSFLNIVISKLNTRTKHLL